MMKSWVQDLLCVCVCVITNKKQKAKTKQNRPQKGVIILTDMQIQINKLRNQPIIQFLNSKPRSPGPVGASCKQIQYFFYE
jgi:hypothetical protein